MQVYIYIIYMCVCVCVLNKRVYIYVYIYYIHRCVGFDMNTIVNMLYTHDLNFNDHIVKMFVNNQ